MLSESKGVGAGIFLAVRRIFARISQTCPKRFCATFPYRFSLTKIMKTLFFYWIPHKNFLLGATFYKWPLSFFGFAEKKSNFGPHFCPGFQGFCPAFQQIKTFEGVLSPPVPPPTPLSERKKRQSKVSWRWLIVPSAFDDSWIFTELCQSFIWLCRGSQQYPVVARSNTRFSYIVNSGIEV